MRAAPSENRADICGHAADTPRGPDARDNRPMTHTPFPARRGGRLLVDQLLAQGVTHAYCVPGESYLAVLDALHDAPIALTVCRQEGGAAMMAEAHGKLTGQPGVCFVTRGPGATNASAGVHVARQDSTPLILFVGQVRRDARGREGFQELDYARTFADLAKWTVEVDSAARLPELVSRAFHVACGGRPGPVVVALPEDVLDAEAAVEVARLRTVAEPAPSPRDLLAVESLLAEAERPLLIAGGSRWTSEARRHLRRLAEDLALPVATSFRRQGLVPTSHPCHVGELGVACEPALVDFAAGSDLILLVGGRLAEVPSQGWTLLDIPNPRQRLVHVHPGPEELGRVYRADVAINATPETFLEPLARAVSRDVSPLVRRDDWSPRTATRHAERLAWSTPTATSPGAFDPAGAVAELAPRLPSDAVVTNGAGNYATWVHRFHPVERPDARLAPTSGSMGYGLPAAIAAARLDPSRPAIAFAGDGCFLMTGQELATAVQYALPVVIVVIDNGMYGTIRMHQERHYPGRVSATELRNPDFAAYARAFGAHGERVERTEAFGEALDRALAANGPAVLHCLLDPEAITIERTLSELRDGAPHASNPRK